jgi:aconitate hydratase
MTNKNSFGAASVLRAGERSFPDLFPARPGKAGFPNVARLPYSLKVLLENLLRHEDGRTVTAEQIQQLANWSGRPEPTEISFMPARVLLQDFTGVPCVVDLPPCATR